MRATLGLDRAESGVQVSSVDDVIRRVRQLYALAEGTSSEGEAANAMATADRLMQAWREAMQAQAERFRHPWAWGVHVKA